MVNPRVIVIGLDSFSPRIGFGLMDDVMPCLKSLREGARYGPLRSTDPPVTVPAWVTMTSGLSPSELGIYGFRNRRKGSYDMGLVSARDVVHPRLWDIAADRGLSSVAVSVPLTYPPMARAHSTVASCFLTPGPESAWLAPSSLRAQLEARFGSYLVDVPDYRTDDKERLLAGCEALTVQHFGIFRQLIRQTTAEFAMMVDLAPDRLHHGLLGSILPEHPDYDERGAFVEKCRGYYRILDREIQKTLDLAGPRTHVFVVSDHGVRPLEGGVCVNEWLLREGYLVLEEIPERPTPLSRLKVDWRRTKAWGEGGHHCRICFNVKRREPAGIVEPTDLEKERLELARRIHQLAGPDGEPFDNKVIFPEHRFVNPMGLPPDLTVYWDNLARRSIGTVGHGAIHVAGNDTGPDEANHAAEGIFIHHAADQLAKGPVQNLEIRHVFQVVLGAMGLV
ncbi:MAG: phosphodiesterase [Proteobacteria bacterium]|nr:phosphodiesterase [Pseudomonadota bacterium]